MANMKTLQAFLTIRMLTLDKILTHFNIIYEFISALVHKSLGMALNKYGCPIA